MEQAFSENFRAAFDLIAPNFTRKNLPKFDQLITKLDENEKDLIMFLAVIFQIPAVAMRGIDHFATKYKLSVDKLAELLPDTFYNYFFEKLPSLVFIGVNLFSKLALVCSYELPMRVMTKFAKTILGIDKCHQMQPIFHELVRRDSSIVNLLVKEFDPNGQAEKALSNVLSWVACPTFSFETMYNVAGLFLSGKASMRTPLFDSFALYVSIHVAKRSILGANTDATMMAVFEILDKSVPEFHKKALGMVRAVLGQFPLPYISFSLFFHDFVPAEKKLAMKSLVSPRSSVKSFLVVSESLDQDYLRGLYSLCLCGKLCVYQIFRQTISFVPRVVDFLESVHYPYPVILKVFEIASYTEFEKIAFGILKSLGRHCSLALVAKHVLKVFTTREKKRIISLIGNYGNQKIDIVTSMYLIGISKLISGQRLRVRYRSLLKAVLGKMTINEIDSSKPMPPELKKFFQTKPKTIGALMTFLDNVKPAVDICDMEKILAEIDQFVVPKVDAHPPPSTTSKAIPPKAAEQKQMKLEVKPKAPSAPAPAPAPAEAKKPAAPAPLPKPKPPLPTKPPEKKPAPVASPRTSPVKPVRQIRSVPVVSELTDDDSFDEMEVPSDDYSAGKSESSVDTMAGYSGYDDVVLSDDEITQFAQLFRPSPTH